MLPPTMLVVQKDIGLPAFSPNIMRKWKLLDLLIACSSFRGYHIGYPKHQTNKIWNQKYPQNVNVKGRPYRHPAITPKNVWKKRKRE